jgi:hypothetical protein
LIAAFFVYNGGRKCLPFLKHSHKCIGITSLKNQESHTNTLGKYRKKLTEEIENNLNNEKDNFRSFYYELKQREDK